MCTCNFFFFTRVQRVGVMRQELAHFLKQLELKKRKILTLLPFLEFITWSLLKEDSQVQDLDKRSINIKKKSIVYTHKLDKLSLSRDTAYVNSMKPFTDRYDHPQVDNVL